MIRTLRGWRRLVMVSALSASAAALAQGLPAPLFLPELVLPRQTVEASPYPIELKSGPPRAPISEFKYEFKGQVKSLQPRLDLAKLRVRQNKELVATGAGDRFALEQAEANPFLERFYREPRHFALQTELFFLFQRMEQLREVMQDDLFSGRLVADFLIDKDPLFASMNLTDDGMVGQQVFAGEATRLAYMTEEAKEGRNAFLEKRKPNFKNIKWIP